MIKTKKEIVYYGDDEKEEEDKQSIMKKEIKEQRIQKTKPRNKLERLRRGANNKSLI